MYLTLVLQELRLIRTINIKWMYMGLLECGKYYAVELLTLSNLGFRRFVLHTIIYSMYLHRLKKEFLEVLEKIPFLNCLGEYFLREAILKKKSSLIFFWIDFNTTQEALLLVSRVNIIM